ncbi:MAG: NAD(P)-dependent oxidoreductase [Lachnospiraceae bacterium]|nr:NAD(P)-dependent oxidoreductase [Lachnospiraceae bacterium]
MKTVVGSTGFVGSNLMASGQIDRGFHSTDIAEAYGLKPDLCIYAGLRAEKYLANSNPAKDMKAIEAAIENIRKIDPVNLVLISTIDVFASPKNVDESTVPSKESLLPYGYNRLILEERVREMYPECLIVRLPGLYGRNIKKNFIFDCINRIPTMLKAEKMDALSLKEPSLRDYYGESVNGFCRVRVLSDKEKESLKAILETVGFSALNFTDSRSRFQFYPLKRLRADIDKCLENGIKLFHPATEPVSAGELYRYVYGRKFVNECAVPADYDYRTVYDGVFDGHDGYIMDKESVLKDILNFIGEQSK